MLYASLSLFPLDAQDMGNKDDMHDRVPDTVET